MGLSSSSLTRTQLARLNHALGRHLRESVDGLLGWAQRCILSLCFGYCLSHSHVSIDSIYWWISGLGPHCVCSVWCVCSSRCLLSPGSSLVCAVLSSNFIAAAAATAAAYLAVLISCTTLDHADRWFPSACLCLVLLLLFLLFLLLLLGGAWCIGSASAAVDLSRLSALSRFFLLKDSECDFICTLCAITAFLLFEHQRKWQYRTAADVLTPTLCVLVRVQY